MAEEFATPYSARDHQRALLWAALLGWAGVTAMEFRHATSLFQVVGLLPFAAVLGLPIAFLGTWLIGGPILRRIMRRPVSWGKAAAGGAGIAALLAAISIAIGRLNGYRISQDPTFHFWTAREVDGILTPLGWRMLAIETVMFIALGAAIGLVIRRVIGPGRELPF